LLVSVGCPLTVNVTFATCAAPWVGTTVMGVLYTPAARPDALAVTERVALVVPEVGVTVSQVGTDDTVNPSPFVALFTERVCDAVGVVEPAVAAKLRFEGLKVIDVVVATTRVTGIEAYVTVPSCDVILTDPVYVFTGKFDGLTVTII
jgi:hypothetical protein